MAEEEQFFIWQLAYRLHAAEIDCQCEGESLDVLGTTWSCEDCGWWCRLTPYAPVDTAALRAAVDALTSSPNPGPGHPF